MNCCRSDAPTIPRRASQFHQGHPRRPIVVANVAQQLDVLPGQVALAWLLHHAANVLPIPGTTSITHLEQYLAASRLRLSTKQYDLIAASQDSDEHREPQA